MTILELIQQLQEAIDDGLVGENAEIRLQQQQPHYPLDFGIGELLINTDPTEEGEIVYITEGGSLGYGTDLTSPLF